MAGRTLKLLAVATLALALVVAVAAYRDVASRRAATAHEAAMATPTQAGSPSTTMQPPPVTSATPGATPARATPTLTPSPPPPSTTVRTALVQTPLPFASEERLAYTVRWSGMEAAWLTLELTAGATPGTLRLRADGATLGLVRAAYDARSTTVVTCSADTLLPIELRRETRERDQTRIDTARYRHDVRLVEVDGHELPLSPGAREPLTALYALRAGELGTVGAVVELAVNELGAAFEIRARVLERTAATVKLDVVSVAPGMAASELKATVVLEAGGSRRILMLSASTPGGDVLVTLDQPAP